MKPLKKDKGALSVKKEPMPKYDGWETWYALKENYDNFFRYLEENKDINTRDNITPEYSSAGTQEWIDRTFDQSPYSEQNPAYSIDPSFLGSSDAAYANKYLGDLIRAARGGSVNIQRSLMEDPAKIARTSKTDDTVFVSAIDPEYIPKQKAQAIQASAIDTGMGEKGLASIMDFSGYMNRNSKPIYKADRSTSTGQYQVGEYVWDNDKKKWQKRMWDKEDQKASKSFAIKRTEGWRKIKAPKF